MNGLPPARFLNGHSGVPFQTGYVDYDFLHLFTVT